MPTGDQILRLPETFEKLIEDLGETNAARLNEFVVRIQAAEADILSLLTRMQGSGRIVFLLGPPGTGKSTFARFLPFGPLGDQIRSIEVLDAGVLVEESTLNALLTRLTKLASQAKSSREGFRLVAIEHLENLAGIGDEAAKDFFRRLNGVLRTGPLLIVWPVTLKEDVDRMLALAASVSDTLFGGRGREVVQFSGPAPEHFPAIVKRTVPVLNGGRPATDFHLTEDVLDTILDNLQLDPDRCNIRSFIRLCWEHWQDRSGYVARLVRSLRRPTEVWCVFCYTRAEEVIAQFAPRANTVRDAWRAQHAALSQYLHDNQSEAIWTASRLQLALDGLLRTRILYLPTNALVSCVSAYSGEFNLTETLPLEGVPDRWTKRSEAHERIKSSPLGRQLKEEVPAYGARRSGPAREALKQAESHFAQINQFASKRTRLGGESGGARSDQALNRCVAKGIEDALGLAGRVFAECEHPSIPHIFPDIRVDYPEKHVCIEMCYTNDDRPSEVAAYVLRKLNAYMQQVEAIRA